MTDRENGEEELVQENNEQELEQQPEPEQAEIAEEDQAEEPTEAAAPQDRFSRRIQQEVSRRREIEAQLETLRRQNEEIRQQLNRPVFDPAERQRRLDMMDPLERERFLSEERDREWQVRVNRLEYMMMANNDQASFRHYLIENPDYRRYEDQVEHLFNEAVQRNQPQSRNAILSWIIGEEARAKRTEALSKANKKGQENIKRATTRPILGRSQLARGEDRRQMSAEERLKHNLEIGAYGTI